MASRGGKGGSQVDFLGGTTETGARSTSAPVSEQPVMSDEEKKQFHITNAMRAESAAEDARSKGAHQKAAQYDAQAAAHRAILRSMGVEYGTAASSNEKAPKPPTIFERVNESGKHERSERDIVSNAMTHLTALENHHKALTALSNARMSTGTLSPDHQSQDNLDEAADHIQAAKTLLTDPKYENSYPYHKANQNRAEKHNSMSAATGAIVRAYQLMHSPVMSELSTHSAGVEPANVLENHMHALTYSDPRGLGFKRLGNEPKTTSISGVKVDLNGARGAIKRLKKQVEDGEYQGDPAYLNRVIGQSKRARRLTSAEKNKRYEEVGAQTDKEKREVANPGSRRGANPLGVLAGYSGGTRPTAGSVTVPPRPGDVIEPEAPRSSSAPKVVTPGTEINAEKTSADVAKVEESTKEATVRKGASRAGKKMASSNTGAKSQQAAVARAKSKAAAVVQVAKDKGMSPEDVADAATRQQQRSAAAQAAKDRASKVAATQKKINKEKIKGMGLDKATSKRIKSTLKDMGKL